MKKFFLSGLLLVSAHQLHARGPVIKGIPADHVYAPKGFDTNDEDVQVIVTGFLPNLCYKSPRSRVEIVGNTLNIHMEARFWQITSAECAQVIVPYLEVVSLGTLKAGTYDIKVNEETPTFLQNSIEITPAAGVTIDDHIYAAVQKVEAQENSRKITLSGVNPGSCLALDEIKYISNGKDTYSVLPILKQVSQDCSGAGTPFSYESEVPVDIKTDTLLLHIRVMQGDSFNTLYKNK